MGSSGLGRREVRARFGHPAGIAERYERAIGFNGESVMEKLEHLRLADVRALFRLLNEVRELGLYPLLWKRHMLTGLCGLIGGQVGIYVQTFDAGVVDLTRSVVADVGWGEDKQRLNWLAYCRRNDLSVDPSRAELTRLMAAGGAFVRGREQLCPDRPWYSSDHVQITRKESDVDSFIFSYRRLTNPSRHQWLYLLRPWNARPFQSRHRRMVQLFHDELGRVIDEDVLRTTRTSPTMQLSPRLRQTFDLLAAGLAEKQVAERLGCSCNTIHGYVKELHRRLGVNTRSELLIQFHQTRRLGQARLVL